MSTQVRERVSRSEVRTVKVSRLPFGMKPAEAIAAILAIVVFVFAVFSYFSSLRPEQERLRLLQSEMDEQQRNIIAGGNVGGSDTTIVDTTQTALDSLNSFKTNHLKPFSSGRIELITQINAIAKKNNVVLTSGIEMGSSLGESADADKAAADKKGPARRKKADEILNAIPSVSFRFTVFGPYPNLRTFINEFEHEKQFLVINAINLTNQEGRGTSRRSRGEGGGASGIMLTIEMTAYFQPM